MRLAPILPLAALLLLIAPVAAAQAPEPSEVVDKACALAPVELPVCPRSDPAPAEPGQAHHHPQAPDAPASPQDAQQLAQEAAGQVQGAAQDPQTAPQRALALVATIAQFVKDL